MVEAGTLLRVARASRELAHATSHLADVAAELAARRGEDALADQARVAANVAARAAFRLDDLLRAPPGDAWLPASIAAVEEAARSLQVVSEALRAAPATAP